MSNSRLPLIPQPLDKPIFAPTTLQPDSLSGALTVRTIDAIRPVQRLIEMTRLVAPAVVIALIVPLTFAAPFMLGGQKRIGIVIFTVGGVIMLGISLVARYSNRFIDNTAQLESLEREEIESLADLLPSIIHTRFHRASLVELLNGIAENGQTGQTLCIQRSDSELNLQPLGVGFEPLELNQSDSAFIELQRALAGNTATGERDVSLFAGRFGRNLGVHGISYYTPQLLAAYVLILWLNRRLGRLLIPLYVVGLIYLTIWMARRTDSVGDCTWFLAPQRLFRRHNRKAGAQRLTCFDRSECVMIAYPRGRTAWQIHVADGDRCEHLFLTRNECELLLRAWLSPVTPPPADRMSDLE